MVPHAALPRATGPRSGSACGPCAIATARFVGDVGITDFKRDIDPPLAALEAGWVVAPQAQGHGYATEALAAAIAWFERSQGAQPIACMIDPPNAPSRRVAAKHGFVEDRRAVYHGEEVMIFIHARADLIERLARALQLALRDRPHGLDDPLR